MDIKDCLKIKGKFKLILRDEFGNIKEQREVENLITTAGKAALATWLAQATQAAYFMPYMAVGTGTTPAAVTDTQLETEGCTRIASTITNSTNTFIHTATFPAGNGTGALTEVGILSASSSGTLFSHSIFSVINKGASDGLEIIYTFTIS